MAAEQLPLPVAPRVPTGEPAARRLPSRVSPMLPTEVAAPFDDPDYLFEAWWPGARAIASCERGLLRLQVAGLADAEAAFPELATLPSQLAEDGTMLDGTLLILDDDGRPDADLLRQRLAGLGRPGRPAYIASDLLWAGGQSVRLHAFRVRRTWLEAILEPGDRATVGRGYRGDGTLLAEALSSMGFDGLSARHLGSRYRSGSAGDAWLRAPITPGEPRPRPTLALILRLPLGE